ncbi:MAG: hypothetical protein LBR81_07705 [Prevotellaceae bacterium]|jgi:hypothetical protein|nr:hypothetical protein [Prevotellaceae bacterium]
MKNQETNGKPSAVTAWLALGITFSVLAATMGIAIYSFEKGSSEIVLQTLIPLWSTWVGTVLAFYFGKNNFDAATKSYQAVIKQLTPHEKMAKLMVKDYMIPVKEIEYLDESEYKNKIYDIMEYPRFKPYNRFAFFDNKGVAKYIIHRKLFDWFIAAKVKESKSTEEIKGLTLQDFIKNYDAEINSDSDAKIKKRLKDSFAVVSIDATLAEAKTKMDEKCECTDVFVTETGDANEKVLGLITNNIILKEASKCLS